MHRVDSTCHWCGEVKSGITWPSISANTLRSAAAVALMITAATGVWQYAPQLRDLAATVRAENIASTQSAPAGSQTAGFVDAPVASNRAENIAVQDSAAVLLASSAATRSPDDSITWTPAVARTWVNVRSDASRGGQVVGVIKPSSRAMLGTDRAGWRQVRSLDVTGWVDPRLFEADSLRTRGE